MIFNFEERPSDSPLVDRVWRTTTQHAGQFAALAANQWELVVTCYQGRQTISVRGPSTRPSVVPIDIQAEFFGIIFRHGAFLPRLPAERLVNAGVDLPEAAGRSFWLDSAAWDTPTYDNADTFVSRLVRAGALTCDPAVIAALSGRPADLTARSVQRRFLRATGLTHGAIRQIERARHAAFLLQTGHAILDTVAQAGYADQPHLTRSLRRYVGLTPARLTDHAQPVETSLLFKTALASS